MIFFLSLDLKVKMLNMSSPSAGGHTVKGNIVIIGSGRQIGERRIEDSTGALITRATVVVPDERFTEKEREEVSPYVVRPDGALTPDMKHALPRESAVILPGYVGPAAMISDFLIHIPNNLEIVETRRSSYDVKPQGPLEPYMRDVVGWASAVLLPQHCGKVRLLSDCSPVFIPMFTIRRV